MDTRLLLDAPGEPRNRIQIAQLGEFDHSRYGKVSITADDIKQWQTNLQHLPGGRALIDLDHRADRMPRNTEAAGWITDISLDGDKAWGTVEWSDLGRKAITDKRYLFFSPSFGKFKNETGETYDNTLQGGALTNKPYLTRMATVSFAAPERVVEAFEREEDDGWVYTLDVSADERKLAAKEGNALPDGSYPIRNNAQLHAAAILAASGHGDVQGARKLITRRAKELGVDLKTLPGFDGQSADSRRAMATVTENTLKLLDLPEDADDAAVEAAVQKALDAATAPVVEPTEQVVTLEAEVKARDTRIMTLESAVTKLEKLHDELNVERTEREFTATFDTAMRQGRVADAQRDEFRAFYTLDADKTTALLEKLPQVVRVVPSGWDNTRDNPENAIEPPNTHGYQLDQQVKQYLVDNKLTMRDYPTVLAQVARGEVAL